MRPLVYGQISGPQTIFEFPIGASEHFLNLSGHFVASDTAGRVQIANATDVNIVGWAYHGESNTSAVEGAEKCGVNVAVGAVYEMPACGTAGAATTEAVLAGCLGETTDIQLVSTYYQYASVVASAVDILLCVGYRYYGAAAGQQSLIVMINPDKCVYTSHD